MKIGVSKRMNIFIEGIPGSGKSTFLKKLASENKSYTAYYEGDLSPIELAWCAYLDDKEYNSLLCKYQNSANDIRKNTIIERDGKKYKYIVSYTKIDLQTPEMFSDFEKYEIYGGRLEIRKFLDVIKKRYTSYYGNKKLFECAMLQNIVDEVLLFSDLNDNDIINFYDGLVKDFKFDYFIYYFEPGNIMKALEKISNERINENGDKVWLNSVINYIKGTKYGKKNDVSTITDLAKYYEKRISLEKKILKKVFSNRYQIFESANGGK